MWSYYQYTEISICSSFGSVKCLRDSFISPQTFFKVCLFTRLNLALLLLYSSVKHIGLSHILRFRWPRKTVARCSIGLAQGPQARYIFPNTSVWHFPVQIRFHCFEILWRSTTLLKRQAFSKILGSWEHIVGYAASTGFFSNIVVRIKCP